LKFPPCFFPPLPKKREKRKEETPLQPLHQNRFLRAPPDCEYRALAPGFAVTLDWRTPVTSRYTIKKNTIERRRVLRPSPNLVINVSLSLSPLHGSVLSPCEDSVLRGWDPKVPIGSPVSFPKRPNQAWRLVAPSSPCRINTKSKHQTAYEFQSTIHFSHRFPNRNRPTIALINTTQHQKKKCYLPGG